MKIQTAVFTNQGGRGNNEDNAGYYFDESEDYGVWLVADGLGGHKNGEVASRLAVETGVQAFHQNHELTEENITNIFCEANKKVLEGQQTYSGMKTTFTGLFVSKEEALWAHIGDSRLYSFENGVLAFQTKDHSVSQIAVNMGEITLGGIRGHDDRSKLLRALGDREDISPEVLKDKKRLAPGDTFLLCSDGFWEYVYETEMEIDLAKSAEPNDWLMYMAMRLNARAPENNDNFTAMAVFIR